MSPIETGRSAIPQVFISLWIWHILTKWRVFLLTTGIGAVLNAASFIGGSYLAQYLTGKDQDAERKRHDLAIEKYQADYNEWKKSLAAVEQWKQDREEQEGDAAVKFRSTDEAFGLLKEQHPNVSLDEPKFSDYYQASKDQRNGELIFTCVTVAGLTYGLSKVVQSHNRKGKWKPLIEYLKDMALRDRTIYFTT